MPKASMSVRYENDIFIVCANRQYPGWYCL